MKKKIFTTLLSVYVSAYILPSVIFYYVNFEMFEEFTYCKTCDTFLSSTTDLYAFIFLNLFGLYCVGLVDNVFEGKGHININPQEHRRLSVLIFFSTLLMLILYPSARYGYLDADIGAVNNISLKLSYYIYGCLLLPALFLIIISHGKLSFMLICCALFIVILYLTAGKRIEILMPIFVLSLVAVAIGRVSRAQFFFLTVFIAILIVAVGYIRIVYLYGENEATLLTPLQESTFIFRTFLFVAARFDGADVSYVNFLDYVLDGLRFSIPSTLIGESEFTDMLKYGGRVEVSPLGGMFFLTPFFGYIGLIGVLVPYVVYSVLMLILRMLPPKIAIVGYILMCSVLLNSVRDNFFIIFKALTLTALFFVFKIIIEFLCKKILIK